MSKDAPGRLSVPVAKWLHGGQPHSIMLAGHGMDILGYLLHDLGVAKAHLARHAMWWLLPEHDQRKFVHIPYMTLENLQTLNDDPALKLKARQRAIASELKSINYKVEWT